jgi:sulfonate transport system substrate-binding protein
VLLTASAKFHDANPKAYKAFCDGLSEAITIINSDKRAAAALYLAAAQDKKNSVDDILKIISDKDYNYTLRPEKVFKTAQFMAEIGSIKQAPAALADLFFPENAKWGGD